MKMLKEIVRKKDKVIIETKEFRGYKFLDIRVYYPDDYAGEYKPTKKGLSFNNINDIEQLISILEENKKDIESYLHGTSSSKTEGDSIADE